MAHILLAEDNAVIRLDVAGQLEAQGHQVEWAQDGEDAVVLLAPGRGEPFDLVVCDSDMPKLNGLQVLARMRHDPRTAATPFVMHSLNDDMDFVDLVEEAGAVFAKKGTGELMITVASLLATQK
jgi:CheY-like chemotaxis protein